METEFEFRLEHSRLFGTIHRPVARVIFINQEREFPQWAYVDSGADMTLIPKSLGDLIGFKVSDQEEIKEVKGVGERGIPVILKKTNIQIGDKKIESHVAWSLIEEVPLLLGRKDVFDTFEIIFKNNKTVFRC